MNIASLPADPPRLPQEPPARALRQLLDERCGRARVPPMESVDDLLPSQLLTQEPMPT